MKADIAVSYHHHYATIIQKRWRGIRSRKIDFPIAKRTRKSIKLLRALVQGFKIRKIWACKEVVSLITTIKDLEKMKVQWE